MSGRRPEQGWFDKAEADLEMARRALGPGNPLPAMACYHAQPLHLTSPLTNSFAFPDPPR